MSSKVAPQDAASDRGSTYAVVENVENNDSHTISIRRASQQEETEASIAGMLANARAEGRSARFRLTVVPVVAGLFLMFGSIFLYAIGVPYIAALFPPGAVVVGLSLLPNDKMAIRAALGIEALICGIAGVFVQFLRGAIGMAGALDGDKCYQAGVDLSLDEDKEVDCAWVFIAMFREFAIGIMSISLCVYFVTSLIKTKDSGPLLDRFFFTNGRWMLGIGISGILTLISIIGVVAYSLIAERLVFLASFGLTGLIFAYPEKLRGSMRSFLLSRREHGTAASVAAFLGGHSPAKVQTTAKALFRAISLDKLLKEDMAKNEPDPQLYLKTVEASLGLVDAFVSHSWHDDSELKWEQLQAYREDFKKKNGGREPLVWIDKCKYHESNSWIVCSPFFPSFEW